jgi:hypothetical protein
MITGGSEVQLRVVSNVCQTPEAARSVTTGNMSYGSFRTNLGRSGERSDTALANAHPWLRFEARQATADGREHCAESVAGEWPQAPTRDWARCSGRSGWLFRVLGVRLAVSNEGRARRSRMATETAAPLHCRLVSTHGEGSSLQARTLLWANQLWRIVRSDSWRITYEWLHLDETCLRGRSLGQR